jgi:hypothetical protein
VLVELSPFRCAIGPLHLKFHAMVASREEREAAKSIACYPYLLFASFAATREMANLTHQDQQNKVKWSTIAPGHRNMSVLVREATHAV